MEFQTPSYIQSLLMPVNDAKVNDRRLWAIPLQTVWVPFFIASNVMGNTQINPEALGAPLRLAYNSDGSVKYSKSGKPVFKVAPELATQVKLVRANFIAQIQSFTNMVASAKAEEFKAEVTKSQQAGQAIINRDRLALEEEYKRLKAGIVTEAEQVAEQAEAKAEQTEAKAEQKAEAKAEQKPKVGSRR